MHLFDRNFLLALGVQPYDPSELYRSRREDSRTRFLQVVAILQFALYTAGLIWTYR